MSIRVRVSKDIKKSIAVIMENKIFMSHGDAQYYLPLTDRVEKLVELWDDKKMIGWSCIYKDYHHGQTSCWAYVNPDYRRKGYGTRLVRQAKLKRKNLQVCMETWDGIPRPKFWKTQGKNLLL